MKLWFRAGEIFVRQTRKLGAFALQTLLVRWFIHSLTFVCSLLLAMESYIYSPSCAACCFAMEPLAYYNKSSVGLLLTFVFFCDCCCCVCGGNKPRSFQCSITYVVQVLVLVLVLVLYDLAWYYVCTHLHCFHRVKPSITFAPHKTHRAETASPQVPKELVAVEAGRQYV